jgi:6-phosphogluconolactonase
MRALFSGYIGTYTHGVHGRARGIYYFEMNSKTGCIEDLRLASMALNPSYLCPASSGKYLYAVTETSDYQGCPAGAVVAYRIGRDGTLQFINQKPSEGTAACHVAVDRRSSFAIVSNYSSGVLTAFPLEADGALGDPRQVIPFSGGGPNSERQKGPHAHFFSFDRKGKYGFACDLGTDRVMAYRFDRNAEEPLKSAEVPWFHTAPGAGPRHMVFNAVGDRAYLLNEIDSTLDVLKYDPARGSFERLQNFSTLPRGTNTTSTAAAIRMSPGGGFVYASNRGHNSIAIFKVKKESPGGMLDFSGILPTCGKTPRDFNFDPSGNFLLVPHQDSDNLVVFRVDQKSGFFKKEREYPVPSAINILFRRY